MLKCKILRKLGIRPTKKSKERALKNPKSFYGDCLMNLMKLKAHYHNLNTSYIKRLVMIIKRKRIPFLHNELIAQLESRLDSILNRSGLAKSAGHASQLISHKLVKVDGRIVNIRSYRVKPGQSIEIIKGYCTQGLKTNLDYLEFISENSLKMIQKPNFKEDHYLVPIDFTKVISALRSR